ncbi:MAG: sialate O-acetylesterase [Defluviitaleaceae bacterium]|nr:sialate O-acetylesterase [Defluviitaleaceae bacterium]
MITLPSFFSTGMVLAKHAKIWGVTTPERNLIAIFKNQKYEITADHKGRFEFTIVSQEYGGPYTLTIADKIIRDVYVGRVWLCGGQSNMEEKINRVKLSVVDEPMIRVFQVEKGLDFNAPAKDVAGKWQSACGEFFNKIYAVPYFFAQKLREHSDVPIGLICNPAGGTPIEGWLPEKTLLEKFPHYHKDLLKIRETDMQKAADDAENNKQTWLTKLNEKDAGLGGGWFSINLDDSDWQTRALFDHSDFPECGSVWFRKDFYLKGKTAATVLNFGRLEDSVTVYVNGVEVTHVDGMYPSCTCILPQGLLMEGKNTITIRVVGEKKRPTIVPGKEYCLQGSDWKIDLNTSWKYRSGAKMPLAPNESGWFYGNPCGVYNYMLAPLFGLSIEGLIWYQGESNTKKPSEYEPMFTEFVKIIRKKFGKNLPVIFTQLANYGDPNSGLTLENVPGKNWAELREQQRQCLKIPNTAMAVTIDCGEYNDLHPYDKKTVGERLALHALKIDDESIAADSPMPTHAEYKNDIITVYFKNANSLWCKNYHPQVDVITENGHLHRLYATIKNDTLEILFRGKPIKIRYGWADCPTVPLYNAYSLPASPFEILLTT